MFNKFTFQNINNENIIDIANHNIKISDECLNYKLFSSSAIGWLNANPNKNFQDLEKFLRNNNLNTHLFCTKPDINKDFYLGLINNLNNSNEINYKWLCNISCKPKNIAKNDITKYWSSYQENFNQLCYAGSLIPIKNKNNNIDDNISIETNELEANELETNELEVNELELTDEFIINNKEFLLQNNKIKINVEKINQHEFFREIRDKMKQDFGVFPTSGQIGLKNTGDKIYGLFINGKLESYWGYVIGKDNKFTLVDLRNLNN